MDEFDAGWVTDEWERWQQGDCLQYAAALLELRPDLHSGSFGDTYTDEDLDPEYATSHMVNHHFVTDGTWAWDSAGRHRMPYLGIDGTADFCWEDDPVEDYEEIIPEAVVAAKDHARRHDIFNHKGE